MKKVSPLGLVLLVGIGVLLILLLRGLDIGPLHTDVIIHYAWFDQFGIGGFPDRYFDINQRHVLVGPVYALAYRLFGENDLPYHLIFQSSRILEGAFLAGIVFQLTARRLLAVCAGLALALTPLRLAELYQGINWFVEPSLVFLLASTYTYVLFLKSNRFRWLLFGVFVAAYALSVLLYESGLPWIAVNLTVGWLILEQEPPRRRLGRIALHAVPTVLIAGALTYAVIFVFEPWNALKPEVGSGLLDRLLEQLSTGLTFPKLVYDRWQAARTDGYVPLIVASGLGAAAALSLLAWLTPKDSETHAFKRDFARLLLLSAVMLFCSVLLGISSPDMNHVYVDRITFGRAVGIALLYVTLILGLCSLLRTRRYPVLAAASAGLLLVGPGFAWLVSYQDYAQETRGEIDHITDALLDVRGTMVSPVHVVVITLPDWPGARFPDAVDVVNHEAQQKIWERGGDATIDILKKGNAGIGYEWETKPGSCETISGEAQAGMCLDRDGIRLSRWSVGGFQPYENVVVVRYDHHNRTMTILPQISLSDLHDYNVTTSGPRVLKTNPARVVAALE